MSVIDEVRREREDLARVLKKHTGIRRIVEDLYPDSAHFIYELLQNAEDTRATEARFTLSKSGLVFEHNGRPFEPRDIYAITDIGEGTKANDDDKIGRFGVGFKAVFAYSETPHIWSPPFAFKITDLVLPCELEPETTQGNCTRFEFPFNNPKKSVDTAYAEVDAGLNELAETTLLFLSNLESIRWQNAAGDPGEVLRFKHSENHFEVLKQSGGKTTSSSHFLKFDQPVVGLEKQRIAVAYDLDFLPNVQAFDPAKMLAKQLKIIPAKPGRVAVFFPAEKETSGLRFHLHAPFVPELSRASIKETNANQPLFEQLATLTAFSLHQIRDLGLLTLDVLSVLPNPQDTIPPRYQCIRKAVVEEMNEQPLTPTHAKSHAPAKHLLQAKASLKELLSNDDIAFLVDYDEEPLQWASGRALQGTNIERFMTGLAMADWDIDEFVNMLAAKASDGFRHIPYAPYHVTGPNEQFMIWLAGKPVDWLQELYSLLYTDYLSNAGWKKHECIKVLKSLRIVRLSSGNFSIGTKCFFPSEGVEHEEVLPRVEAGVFNSGKSKVQQESAKRFLEEIGVRQVGEAEQVEAILKKRYTKANLTPKKMDLKRFVAFVEKEPDKAKLFSNHHIFECKDGKWRLPSRVFLDQPFMDTGLGAYYDAPGMVREYEALAATYQDCGIATKRLVKFAEAVGVKNRLEVTETTCYSNPQWVYLWSVGGNSTSTSINRDYLMAGLEVALARPSLAISRLVWQSMCSLPPSPNCLKATYQNNQSRGAHFADSQLVHQLKTMAWIPQGNGTFSRPAEASRELLPEGFPFDPGWAWLKAIHFGQEAIKTSEAYRQKQIGAKELGFESVEEAQKWKTVKDAGISPDEILAQYAQRQRISQPEESVKDPDKRRRGVREDGDSAPQNESVIRERSIQPDVPEVTATAKAYLRGKYKNPDGQLVCQCCHKEMPFKLRSGDHYFEAVQCMRDQDAHYHQNRLALCPTCAAMYQYARETDDAEIRRRIVEHTADDRVPAVDIPLRLAGGDHTLRFVGTHWFDLRTVLGERKDIGSLDSGTCHG
ncbi:MAG: hypothetical protein NDI91_15850 [Sulfuritalea sp.]|nr:hypothetical protein [Sulfuritalea sp.]